MIEVFLQAIKDHGVPLDDLLSIRDGRVFFADQRVTSHSGRFTAANLKLRAGVSREMVRATTGHASLRMLRTTYMRREML